MWDEIPVPRFGRKLWIGRARVNTLGGVLQRHLADHQPKRQESH